MNEIVFEIIRVIVMLAVLVITSYLVPWLAQKIGNDKLETAEKWAKYAVLMAQQTMQAENGTERKTYVTDFLKGILTAKNISLTDEQIDVLIESAVKTMKMDENKISQ